jgi:hypothetical protein
MYGERGDGVEDGEGASGPGKGATKVSNISALRHLLIFPGQAGSRCIA